MRANRSTWEILGSLLGLVILIVIINAAVGYYRQGSTDFAEQARVAGRPLTLTEVLDGDTGATEEITGTTDITDTAGVTATIALTATGATTETATAITTTTDITETALLTTSTDLTVTQTTTTTTDLTATTTISEAAPALTTSVVVTTSTEVTSTAELTTTGAVSPTKATGSTEAPAELAAVFVKAGCIGCHVIPGVANAVGMIGPNLTNIGVDGATRVAGLSSEEYIRQSLLEPNAVIAPTCPTGPCLPNLMVQNLGDILTAEEIDAVVAYLSVQGTTAP